MIETLQRVLRPLARAVDNMVARAVVRLVASNGFTQILQAEISAGEVKNDLDHLEAYGMAAAPLPGSVALCLFVGGERDNGAAILVHDQRHRPRTLAPGDVALFTDQDDPAAAAEDARHRIQLTRDGTLVIRCRRLDIKCGDERLVMEEGTGFRLSYSDFEATET